MSLGIGDLDIGVSSSGMNTYKENLKTQILTTMSENLDTEYQNIVTAVDGGWVGVSCDRFKEQLQAEIDLIKSDLTAEYNDLDARLSELANYYYNQDENMIGE